MIKNKIILTIISLLIVTQNAMASEPKVISDVANKKAPTMDAFADVNKYSDNYFSPKPKVDEDLKKVEEGLNLYTIGNPSSADSQTRGTLPPVKLIRLKLKYAKQIKNSKTPVKGTAVVVAPSNQATLDCEEMEYFADKTELEAKGNAVLVFPKNDSSIRADRITYNQSSNFIKAYGNVVLVNGGKEVLGDFMQVDLNEENTFIDNPTTDYLQIHCRAKKGYLTGDKLIQEQGSMYVKDRTLLKLRADMFGPDLDSLYVDEKDKGYYKKDSHGEALRIKVRDIKINSKKDHDVLTLNHAEVYYNEKKIGTIPTITMHTNKAQDYVEANYPEISSLPNLGLYAGPGFVFDTPMGSTLKLIPMFNWDAGKIGAGGVAKFKSATNKTDMAYGTTNNLYIVRGKQRLDDNMWFQYGSNAYMDDWFMGYRMPQYMGELIYENSTLKKDFFGKNFDTFFMNRAAAGYMQDYDTKSGYSNTLGDGGVGTLRVKYMAQVSQTLYKFGNPAETPFNGHFSIVGQGSTAVYGTGDTQVLARFGPMLHTQCKNWMQDIGYFMAGYSDQSPFVMYDKFMYGRSNAYTRQTIRVNKYLALSWFGSVNLEQDCWNGNLLQENTFFVSLGPDDIKLHVGYDTIRQMSYITMALKLDAKGSTIDYKKMEIKNPDKLGKNNGNHDASVFTQYRNSDSAPAKEKTIYEDQYAEVINIKEGV